MHALYSSNHYNMTVRDPNKADGRGPSYSPAHATLIFPNNAGYSKALAETSRFPKFLR